MAIRADRAEDRWETTETRPLRAVPAPAAWPERRPRVSRLAVLLAVLGLAAAAAAVAWYAVLGPRTPPAELTVPRVLGLREPVAVRRLTRAGFRVRVHEPEGARGSGVVVTQVPFPQATVARGSTVTIRISAANR